MYIYGVNLNNTKGLLIIRLIHSGASFYISREIAIPLVNDFGSDEETVAMHVNILFFFFFAEKSLNSLDSLFRICEFRSVKSVFLN